MDMWNYLGVCNYCGMGISSAHDLSPPWERWGVTWGRTGGEREAASFQHFEFLLRRSAFYGVGILPRATPFCSLFELSVTHFNAHNPYPDPKSEEDPAHHKMRLTIIRAGKNHTTMNYRGSPVPSRPARPQCTTGKMLGGARRP